MSILIEKMSMPTSCLKCNFLDYERGYRCMITRELVSLRQPVGRPESCPVKEAPVAQYQEGDG